jgi:hypothetical protein
MYDITNVSDTKFWISPFERSLTFVWLNMCISTYIQLAYFYGYFNLLSFESSYFFCDEFSLFFQIHILCSFFSFWKNFQGRFFYKNSSKNHHNYLQYERCLRFYTFIFGTSPNLEKYTCGLSPLEQPTKVREKNCLKERRLGTRFLTNSAFQRECKMEEYGKAAI